MLNKAILIGRITKEPELKSTPQGTSVLSFNIACQRNFKQDGEYKSDFINCVAWREKAEFISKYFGKGDLISVDGMIQTRSYESDGKKVYVTEVIAHEVGFVESKKEKEEATETLPELPEEFGDVDGRTSDDDLPF